MRKYLKLSINTVIGLAVGLLIGYIANLIAENLKYAYPYCFLFGSMSSLFVFTLKHDWVRANTTLSIICLAISFIAGHIATMIIFFGHGYIFISMFIFGFVIGIVGQYIYCSIKIYFCKKSLFRGREYWDKYDWE